MKKPGRALPKTMFSLFAAGAFAVIMCFFVCSPPVMFPDITQDTAVLPAEVITPAPAVPEPVMTETADPVSEVTPEPDKEPPAPTPETREIEAADITGTLVVKLPSGTAAEALLDGDNTTKYSIAAKAQISITAPDPIYSLYIIWEKPPGQWSLESVDAAGSGTDKYGADGFIHEYAVLSYPAAEVYMHMPQQGAVICDIYAFSAGYSPDAFVQADAHLLVHPPDWVQVWQPPLEKADLLVLPTHADDEHLFFVGTMPYYAGERGYAVQVAYMTNHWNEPPRPHELLDGLWTVGVRNYPVISPFNDRYVDSLESAQSVYGFDNIVGYQVELLRRFKPSVVVGHDLNGEYGHGAHMLSAHALIEAVEQAANPDYDFVTYELYGTWDTPKLYLHLYNENRITMDWDIPLGSFEGSTAREMAAKGYSCHVSQHRWSFAVPESGHTGSVFGLVRTTVGPDIKGGDMFENIITF